MIYTYFQQYGNNIMLSYIDEEGKTQHVRINDYKPTLYTKSEDKSNIKSIFGYYLSPIQFDDIKSANEHIRYSSGVDGYVLEGNAKFANQYLIELYEGKMPDISDVSIRGCIFDIEVTAPMFPDPTKADYPIDAITMYDNVDNRFTVFGLGGSYEHDLDVLPETKGIPVDYTSFEKEDDLLRAIINHIRKSKYNYTSGWHSEAFDIPYIINRCRKVLGETATKRLSPFNMIQEREIFDGYQKRIKYTIMGLPHLDYMILYKKHILTPRESYALGFIAQEELHDTKLDYEEEGTLFNLSTTNFQKYIAYNIKDVDIIRRLDNKLKLFDLTFILSYYSLSNYEDTMGTVRVWEHLIAKELYVKGIAPLCKLGQPIRGEYPGGFVSDPIKGHHDWVVSYDLNSLYPHLEMQINISPETYIPYQDLPQELRTLRDKLLVQDTTTFYNQLGPLMNKEVDLGVLKEYNVSMSAAGVFYRKDVKGVIPTIKEDIYNKRKLYQKERRDNEQLMININKEMNKRGLL